MNVPISSTVNGKAVERDVDPRTLLVQFLREQLRLTGTHVGCDTAQCGACTVHLNGRAVKSCSMLALQVAGRRRSRRSRAWRKDGDAAPDAGGVPRVPRPAVRLLHAGHGDVGGRSCSPTTRRPTEDEIREGLDGNICRCTGYQNIVKSIQFCQSGADRRRRPEEQP